MKLRSEQIRAVTIDGQPIEFETEIIGRDIYTVFNVPSGQHSLEIVKGQPLARPAAIEVEAAPTQVSSAAIALEPSLPSTAPNLVSSPEAITLQGSSLAEPPLETDLVPTDEATALSPNEAEASPPVEMGRNMMSDKTRQNRYAFFRFVGISLAILISLLLMVLVAIRRSGSLS